MRNGSTVPCLELRQLLRLSLGMRGRLLPQRSWLVLEHCRLGFESRRLDASRRENLSSKQRERSLATVFPRYFCGRAWFSAAVGQIAT